MCAQTVQAADAHQSALSHLPLRRPSARGRRTTPPSMRSAEKALRKQCGHLEDKKSTHYPAPSCDFTIIEKNSSKRTTRPSSLREGSSSRATTGHYTLLVLKHKIELLSHSLRVKFYERYQASEKKSLHFLGEELDKAIELHAFEPLSVVCDRIEKGVQQTHSLSSSQVSGQHPSASPLIRLLYARSLVNFGAFCLVNFETLHAVQLLRKAIDILATMSSTDLKWVSDSIAQQNSGEPGLPAGSPLFTADAAVLYLRVLLSNALSCEGRYWEAALEMQEVSAVRRSYALIPVLQVVPGIRGYQTMSADFVNEEHDIFFSQPASVKAAIDQGSAELLLLRSKAASSSEVLRATLGLARLYRHAKLYEKSQELYEEYLEGLIATETKDSHTAMWELGQVLLDNGSADVAAIYLDAAADLLLDEAESIEVKAGAKGTLVSRQYACAATRAASVMLDASLAHQANGQTEKALRVVSQSISLMGRAGLRQHSAWALQHCADLHCSVNQVDQALLCYADGIALLSPTQDQSLTAGENTLQIASQERLLKLQVADVESAIGFCLQSHVGDFRKALSHYYLSLQQASPASSASPSSHPSFPASIAAQEEGDAAPLPSSSTVSSNGLPPDRLHWVLTNIVCCHRRLGDWEAAVAAQRQVLQLEATIGTPLTDSYMVMADLLQQAGEIEKQLGLYFYLFFLPDEMLSPATRLVVAQRFGQCCYQAGSSRMGAVLLQAVRRAQGDHDPVTLVEFALCLKHMSKSDEEALTAAHSLLPRDAEAIAHIFKKAATLAVAQRSMSGKRSSEEELQALMVLNRGAFFFLEVGEEKRALSLYHMALRICEEVSGSGRHVSDEFSREWSIVLANTAMMESRAGHPETSVKLYSKAVEVCPSNGDVLNAAALFCQNEGKPVEGTVFLKKALQLPFSDGATNFLMAQVGSHFFPHADPATKYLLVERVLLSLGVPAESIPSSKGTVVVTEGNLEHHLSSLEPLIEDAVGCTTSGHAANLACFLFQMHFSKHAFLNRLFRLAIARFPSSHDLLFNYANFCSTHNFHCLARKYFTRSLALQESSTALVGYGNYLQHAAFRDSQHGTREQLWRGFLDRNPAEPTAWFHYALLLSRHFPSPFKTEAAFETALRLSPPQSAASASFFAEFLSLSLESVRATLDVSYRTQQLRRVEALLCQAVDSTPTNSSTHFHLSVFYASSQRIEDALLSLGRALECDPNSVEALRLRSSLLRKKCIEKHTEFLQLHQGDASLRRRYPAALQDLISQTSHSYEVAIMTDPNHVATLEQYAHFCVSVLDDPEKAKKLWLQASRAKFMIT